MTGSLQNFAHNARCNMTAAEEHLWCYLRSDIALEKTHFRRQVILGHYIVDFCCHASRLIIEVDGATHSKDQEIKKDSLRTHHLHEMGYRVLRFTNDDVFKSTGSVLDTIYEALKETPHVIADSEKIYRRTDKRTITKRDTLKDTPTPYPSPQGGGEKNNQLRNTNDTSHLPSLLADESQGKGKHTHSYTEDQTSPFPSPLEGEGQGGG